LRENNIDISRNYRNVSDYFRYLETLKEIDDVKLLQEKERLEYRLKKEMLEKRGDSFDFLNSEYSLYLLDRYLNNKASKRDVESYENNVKLKNLQVFSNKLLRKDYFKGYESDLAKAEENMKQFYSVADKRNEVIINNLTGVDFQESNVIAVVIGGYHINGIKDYLKSKGISYEEVIPSVKEGNYKNYYEDRLFEQANWLNINNNRKTDIISIPEVSEQNLVSQKLQLISIFVDKSLISGNSQVEFLLSQDIMNLGQVLNKIKENESKFIAGNLSEVEKLSIAISLAYNYRELNEGIKSELLTTNLGLEIISIFEDSKIDNSSEQMFKDKNIDIYSEVRKNLKLNEDLSEKDKLVITNAIDQEEVYSKTSLIELNQKKYSFFSPVLKTLIGMILVGATVGIFFLFPALPILGLVALGLGALVGVGVLIWGISNIVKTKNIRKQIHSFKEIAAITGQADEELFEAEGIEKEGMARIFENAKKEYWHCCLV
jgi:hypothetical protein